MFQCCMIQYTCCMIPNARFKNPVAALSLSLWIQDFTFAALLSRRIGSSEPTEYMLLQLDNLVYLLESPNFARLRIQLLDKTDHRHGSLTQALMSRGGLCVLFIPHIHVALLL
eukprot:GHVO01052746.1.p1 GENE.GHVO01052746.1~~GHVO01052746.1.p1  ORF type:complete len:113 (+),score=11.98 GHVO01052746.1:188-526(+)